jgi:flagellar hook-associated protein 2
MGSPVTLTGFNSIDWNAVLDAVMTQESVPLTTLETQQQTLQTKQSTFGTLATKLSAFESAVAGLTDDNSLLGRTATSTNDSSIKASASGAAAPGIYDVVVQELARAQVTASVTQMPDADQTVVAWGGTLTIGGVPVNIDAPVTLKGLAERINSTKDIGVTATVVKSSAAAWQLVLTGRATGTVNQFTIANALTGGSGIAFTDTDGNGVSGDSPADNAVQATDAQALVNNVQVVSSTNTIEDAISGVSLTLLKKDPASTTTVTVAEDLGTTKDRLTKLVDTYNDLAKFVEDQNAAAAKGDTSSLARDPLLRGLRNVLRNALTAEYSSGGNVSSLAAVGIQFERTGRLSFNTGTFDQAMAGGFGDIRNLFIGDGTNAGAFTSLKQQIGTYTSTDGLLKDSKDRLSQQVTALNGRIDDLTNRLALRRTALQKEYMAADLAMTQLKNDVSSLSSLNGQYRLF